MAWRTREKLASSSLSARPDASSASVRVSLTVTVMTRAGVLICAFWLFTAIFANIIAPFAWTRMIGTIPITDEAQRQRVERLKDMTPDKIAPMAVFLVSDAAKDVTGQIFGVRANELFLFSQDLWLKWRASRG